jgi:hypothetical protein
MYDAGRALPFESVVVVEKIRKPASWWITLFWKPIWIFQVPTFSSPPTQGQAYSRVIHFTPLTTPGRADPRPLLHRQPAIRVRSTRRQVHHRRAHQPANLLPKRRRRGVLLGREVRLPPSARRPGVTDPRRRQHTKAAGGLRVRGTPHRCLACRQISSACGAR